MPSTATITKKAKYLLKLPSCVVIDAIVNPEKKGSPTFVHTAPSGVRNAMYELWTSCFDTDLKSAIVSLT